MARPFDILKERNDGDWQRYCEHRFVRELADGSLPQEAFRHYLKQDYLFLIQFARAWGLPSTRAGTSRRSARGSGR